MPLRRRWSDTLVCEVCCREFTPETLDEPWVMPTVCGPCAERESLVAEVESILLNYQKRQAKRWIDTEQIYSPLFMDVEFPFTLKFGDAGWKAPVVDPHACGEEV